MHPGKGYIYFTEWSLQPYIARMSMDGSPDMVDPIVKLAENDLGWPNALAIDFYSDKCVDFNFLEFIINAVVKWKSEEFHKY